MTDPATALKPWMKGGPSPNYRGRGKGTPNKFSQQLVADFAADWRKHGADVIARVREKDPVAFLQIATKLVPRECLVQFEARPFENVERLTDEELAEILRNIRGAIVIAEALRSILTKIALVPEAAALVAEAERVIDEFLGSDEHAKKTAEVVELMREVEQLRQEFEEDRRRREAER